MTNGMVEMIRTLRRETGVGVMEIRTALEKSSYKLDEARAFLLENSQAKAEKHSDREALQGAIEVYSHSEGRIGVMVEINTETEFASRSDAFRRFAHEIALQITAAAPQYVRDEDIPAEVLDELAQEAAAAARRQGKPEHIIERVVKGQLEKYRNTHVLLRQPYIRDESVTIAQLLNQAISQVGENIVIRRFVRWELAPDIESE